MAGGKGGSQTTTVEVPEYIEEAAKRNLARAQQISQIGYTPYYGPDVAAFTPLQEASMQNLAGTAGAFGLATPAGGPMSGMPAPQEFAGGIRGYSSAPMFEEALDEFGRRRPAQKAYIDAMFIDPFSGEYTPVYQPVAPIEPVAPVVPTTPSTPSVPIIDTGSATGGAVTSVQDVIDARDTLPPSVLPPVVPAVGGTDPQVGDVVDNAALKERQNQIVVDAFDRFGDVMKDPTLTPEQVAAANPAFNPEIAAAAQDVPVTITTPTGEYTKPAGELTSTDFVAATGGEISTTATEPNMGGLPDFTGGTGGRLADTMEQYQLAGQSAAAAGIRNIGGAYAQSPAGSGELVETRYNPETGQSEIISVGVPFEPITQSQRDFQTELFAADDVSQFLPPQAPEETFGADLLRSLTDPSYDPEGTVLSRLLGGPTQPEDMNAMQSAAREAALGGTEDMREYLSSGAYASASGSAPSSSLSGGATTDRLYAAQAEKQAIQAQAAVDAAAANQAIAAGAAAPTGRFIVQRYDEATPQIFTDQAAAERYARAFGTTAVPETAAAT